MKLQFGQVTTDTYDETSYGNIELIDGKGMDKAIGLRWTNPPDDSPYVSYDIQRSADGINFTTVNDNPFIYMAAEGADEGIYYIDSVPQNKVAYYYRVCPKTAFGQNAGYSDTLQLEAWPPSINGFTLYMGEYDFIDNDESVELNWSASQFALDDNLIEGFNVYRAEEMMGEYTVINSGPIPPSKTSFTDEDPPIAGFYRVVANDINEYEYVSNTVMVQMPDSIPPAIPVNIEGHYVSDEQFSLSWDEVTDEDLAGYRVFLSNQRNGNYTQLTKASITNNTYNGYTDPSIKADSVFLKVLSTDHRSNYSEMSEPLALSRPDNIGPAKPVLTKAMPTPEGVRIGWQYSSAEDVARHILQRKLLNGPTWETVLVIDSTQVDQYSPLDPDEIVPTLMVDSTELQQLPYVYRFLAEDDDYDQSSSAQIQVTPYASVTQGDIEDFDIELETESIPANAFVNAKLAKLNAKTGNVNHNSTGATQYNMAMSWKYEVDDTVLDFQILRAQTGQPLEVVKTITLAEAMGMEAGDEVEVTGSLGLIQLNYRDTELQKGKRYVYQVLTRHSGGGYSERSPTLTKKIPVE